MPAKLVYNRGSLVPDVILLDLNTPKSDGFHVLTRLRETPHLSHVRIAILTSSQAATDKNRSHILGATRYIQKPSQLDEFLSTIGRGVAEMLGDGSRLGGVETPRREGPDCPGKRSVRRGNASAADKVRNSSMAPASN